MSRENGLCYVVIVGGIVIVWEDVCRFSKKWVGIH